MTFGAGSEAFAAASRARSPAARIMSAPPEAWTLRIEAPVRAAAAAAPPTVFGMSWSFRSRKTGAIAATSRTSSGPCAQNASRPTFRTPTSGPTRRASARTRSRSAASRATAIRFRPSGIDLLRPRAGLQGPGQVRDPLDAVPLAPAGEVADEAARDARVAEARRPDLDGVRPRDEELDDVLDGLDPPDPEDRDAGQRPPDLPDHPHGDRTDRGAREAARREADLR